MRPGFDPWVGKIPWRRKWLPTPVFLHGEFNGQRSLEGYSPWVHKSRTQLSNQHFTLPFRSFQVVLVVKNPPASAGNVRDVGSIPGSERFPRMRAWQPTPAFLPGESHGQRSLAGYSPCGRKESDRTEQLTHTNLE